MDRKITSEWEVWNGNKFVDFDGIQKVTKHEYLEIFFENIRPIKCSLEHKFVFNNGLIRAKDIIVGMILSGQKVTDIQYHNEQIELYDLLNTGPDHIYQINDVIFLTNCSFVPRMDEFWSSVFPTISSGESTKVILISTANGQNFFYDTWEAAINGTGAFVPYEIKWWQVPGRDEKWKETQLKAMSQEQFDQEYGNVFLGSSNTLMGISEFRILEKTKQDPIEYTLDMRIFEQPLKDHRYFITVDPASVGEDYSAFHVIDITEYPFKEVLSYSNNRITHIQLPQLLAQTGYKYNNADILIESNEIGQTVLHIINYELEYPNIVSTKKTNIRIDLGLRTTSKSKTLGCARFKEMVGKEKLIVRDSKTIDELKHFVLNGSNYKAEDGFHDDLSMAFVLFCYYVNTSSFSVQFESVLSEELREQYEKETYEALSPLPLFGASINDIENMNDIRGLLGE